MPENSISDEILILEQKREALERVISVVNSLESMADGLRASMELGKSAEQLPLTLLKAYNSLGQKVRNSSDAEIVSRIEMIDAVVKSKLKSILLLTEDKNWAFYEEESQKHHSPLFEEIDNFVRLTHTNVALRVLIEKRTGQTLPFQNLVSASQIRKNVELIEKSETTGRKRVVKDIEVIMKDVNALLSLSSLNDSMRSHLEGVKGDLRQGLKHVISGKPIKELPVDIGVMTLTPVEEADLKPESLIQGYSNQEVAGDVSVDRSADEMKKSVGEKTNGQNELCTKETSESLVQNQTKNHNSDTPTTNNVVSKKRRVLAGEENQAKKSLWAKFCLWLNSPWSTSWRDLKDKERKKK